MATVTHRVSDPDTANATSYVTPSFTPAVDDLLVVFVKTTGTAVQGTLSNSAGIAFTNVGSVGAVDVRCFIANSLATATSMTVTFDCAGDAATGCVIFVASVSGMTRTGASALKQIDTASGAASTTPETVFAANCDTNNPTLGCVDVNNQNPAALTPPTNWSELADTGYSTPTSGTEYIARNSGFAGTTITWGNAPANAWNAVAIELDTSAPPSAANTNQFMMTGVGA